MLVASITLLLAQSASPEFPKGKAIAMLVFFGTAFVVSLFGLLASKEMLNSMSSIIGTNKPVVARIVCAIGVVVSGVAVLVSALALGGVL